MNQQSTGNKAKDRSGFINTFMRLMDSRYLYSIRHGFTLVMPIMIIGSIAILINNFPIPAYQQLMESIWGDGWKQFGSMIYAGTFSVISLVVCLAISSELTGWYREHKRYNVLPIMTQIVSFACVIVTINFVDGELDLTSMTGVNGLFLTIIITILSTELFMRLAQLNAVRGSSVVATDATDSLPAAMKAIVPALVTLSIFVAARLIFNMFGITNINLWMNELMQAPFRDMQNNTLGALAFSFSTHLMWLFGIHGNNVLDTVATGVYTPAMDANIAAVAAGAVPPHMYTKTFFDAFVYMGGSGATMCLIIAIFLFAQRKSTKRLGRISLVTGIFNINEPLMYGLPIVLNPVYFIPFLCTPLVMTLTTSAAMALGWVPYTVQNIEWTTPVFISGYQATGGSMAGVILQIVNLIIGIAIYAPFVKLGDRLERRRFKTSLSRVAQHAFAPKQEASKKLTGLRGTDGVAARQLANDLSALLASGNPGSELRLVYQPLVDVQANKVFGYETLLRWDHPMHGPIAPPVAIALAEDIGQIDALGYWILDTGLAQLAAFRNQGMEELVHFTNLSVLQLSKPDFSEDVKNLLAKHNIPAGNLELEMTESAVLSVDEKVNGNIEKMRDMGVLIALDDFGMGHSSLSYLQVFPSKTIKIDESLTQDIAGGTGSANLNMVQSIVNMCGGLGMELIAERIETKEQLRMLEGIGCFKIQGYYFSKPLTPEEFVAYYRGGLKQDEPAK